VMNLVGRIVYLWRPADARPIDVPFRCVVLECADGLLRVGSLDRFHCLPDDLCDMPDNDQARTWFVVPLARVDCVQFVPVEEITPDEWAEVNCLLRHVRTEHVHPYRGRPGEVLVGLMPSEDFGI
jgi:hypothetical protein